MPVDYVIRQGMPVMLSKHLHWHIDSGKQLRLY
jgi:hypothetical protein